VSEYFREPVGPEQVVWAFSGVRSLADDGATKPNDLSRDYLIRLAGAPAAPLVSIYGGKITTARRLAEEVLARLTAVFQLPPPWTGRVPLPGGEFPPDGVAALVSRARGLWPFLTEAQAHRLVRAYGTRLDRVLGTARSRDDLGQSFGPDLTAAEVRYLMRHEWAETSEDVLWRRSKLGLRLTPTEQQSLAAFMDQTRGGSAAAE
jgi:glycerol-3-phosphate dehydrogenase